MPNPRPTDRPVIRVKAMLVAPNDEGTAHAVAVHPATDENPGGFHRLIGGTVEFGETHRATIVREVIEELGAAIEGLTLLGPVESIFREDGVPGHEIVFVYRGRLDPAPAPAGAVLTEADGSVLPVVWRPILDADEPLPLYPAAAVPLVHDLAGRGPVTERAARC